LQKILKTEFGKYYNKILNEVLLQSVAQVEISSRDVKKLVLSKKQIIEKITMEYDLQTPTLSYVKRYSVMSKAEEKAIKKIEKSSAPKGKRNRFPRYRPSAKLAGDTMDRLAFLFYFNLFLLRNPYHFSLLLIPIPEFDHTMLENGGIQNPKFSRMVSDNNEILRKIAYMIKKDSKLNKVMMDNLNEVNEKYTKPEQLVFTSKLFS